MSQRFLFLHIISALMILLPLTHNAEAMTSESALGDSSTASPALVINGKPVLGRIEEVKLSNIAELDDVMWLAKVDTGADTTSMHADDIEVFSLNPRYEGLTGVELMQTIIEEFRPEGGTNWWLKSFDTPERNIQGRVRFTLTHPYNGEKIEVVRPLARPSIVRNRTTNTPIYRPVVELELTLAGETIKTEINLTDRSHFSTPLLIGKTLLKQHAWVAAGYDFLQQPQPVLVGRKQTVQLGFDDDQSPQLDVSYSMSSRYSMLHATNVFVDTENMVTYTTIGKDGVEAMQSAPLIRMLKVSGESYPLVYAPIKAAGREIHLLAYLKERSTLSTQLRLGLESQSRHFALALGKTKISEQPLSYADWLLQTKPLVISPQEHLLLDGKRIKAMPSTSTGTAVLYVETLRLNSDKKADEVTFSLAGSDGKITKPVNKTLAIGDVTRPVVTMNLSTNEGIKPVEIALEQTKHSEPAQLAIGSKFYDGNVIVDTRSQHLLTPKPLHLAGFIETTQVDDQALAAKLDTGADVSAIHAGNIERFNQNGAEMVSFDIESASGEPRRITTKIIDEMRIRAKAGEETQVRPVVELSVSLGEITQPIAVNLQDRSRFKYKMILGKNFLEHGVIVSSEHTFLLTKDPNQSN